MQDKIDELLGEGDQQSLAEGEETEQETSSMHDSENKDNVEPVAEGATIKPDS